MPTDIRVSKKWDFEVDFMAVLLESFGLYLVTCKKYYSDRREPKDKIVNPKNIGQTVGLTGKLNGFQCLPALTSPNLKSSQATNLAAKYFWIYYTYRLACKSYSISGVK
jgi:hypothetical protein